MRLVKQLDHAKLGACDLDEGGTKRPLEADRDRLLAKGGKAITLPAARVEPADHEPTPTAVADTLAE